MKYENKEERKIFFYSYIEYYSVFTCGKLYVRRQTRVSLWECLFFLLRPREKYFSCSFVIPTCNTYMYPATWRRGSDIMQGNKETSFRSCQHVCRHETAQVSVVILVKSHLFPSIFADHFLLRTLSVSCFMHNSSSLITILADAIILLFSWNGIYRGIWYRSTWMCNVHPQRKIL